MNNLYMREWLSGGASPCQGEGRGFESRLALRKNKNRSKDRFLFFVSTSAHEPMHKCMGSRSPLRSGRRKTKVHRTLCAVSRFDKKLIHSDEFFIGLDDSYKSSAPVGEILTSTGCHGAPTWIGAKQGAGSVQAK